MLNELNLLTRIAATTGALVAWGCALYGALRVADLDLRWQHGICGPWGCGPPPQALVACHAFWVVLLFPMVVAVIRRSSARMLARLGVLVMAAGFLAMSAVGLKEWTGWYLEGTQLQRRYFVQRVLFSVGTLVEIPMLELALAGLAWCIAAMSKGLPRRPVTAPQRAAGASEVDKCSGSESAGAQPTLRTLIDLDPKGRIET